MNIFVMKKLYIIIAAVDKAGNIGEPFIKQIDRSVDENVVKNTIGDSAQIL